MKQKIEIKIDVDDGADFIVSFTRYFLLLTNTVCIFFVFENFIVALIIPYIVKCKYSFFITMKTKSSSRPLLNLQSHGSFWAFHYFDNWIDFDKGESDCKTTSNNSWSIFTQQNLRNTQDSFLNWFNCSASFKRTVFLS